MRSVLSGLTPLAASALLLAYFSALHGLFLFSDLEFSIWMLLLLAPPVGFEIWFTGIFDARRRTWSPVVKSGLAGRIIFIVCCYYLCVWYTLLFNNTPDAVVGLFRRWPDAVRIFWTASPWLSLVLGILLASVYWILTYRHHLFRLLTTILLPAVATIFLAYLFYMHPGSPLRLECNQRPAFVHRVFPSILFPGSRAIFRTPLFAREIYVAPDDSFAVLTFGATFGSKDSEQPNYVWVDLSTRRFGYKEVKQTRHFYSECSRAIYAAPWHGSRFYGFEPLTGTIREYLLPDRVGGMPIFEIAYTYHACDTSTVYLVNTRNPVLFAWDSRSGSLKRTLPLAERGLLRYGDQAIAIARNRAGHKLYLISLGRHELIELDEQTIEPIRKINLPHDPLVIRLSSDERYLYITAAFRAKLWKLDSQSLQVIDTFHAPLHCRCFALSPDDRYLFAGDFLSGKLIVIDTDSGDHLLDFYVSDKIEGMYATEGFLYLTGSEGVFRIALTELMERINERADPR